MTITEITSRIRYNVEDINEDIYVAAEVEDAVNDAKDQTLALVQQFTDKHFLINESLVFAGGVREVALTNKFQTIIYAESAANSGALRRHSIRQLQNRPEGFHDHSPYDLYYYHSASLSSGNVVSVFTVGRYNTEIAETITIWGFLQITDTSTGSNSYSSNIPLLFDNLIIVKATIQLLSARQRNAKNWFLREQKLEFQMMELLKNPNRNEPRMVNYVDESYA